MPTTLTTASGSFTLPDYADPADVPQWLLSLFKRLGDEILPNLAGGGVTAGTLATRPAASKAGRIYRITGDANAGALFLDTGTGWIPIGTVGQLVQLFALAASDVPLTVTAAASQSASLQQWLTSAGAVLARIGATGRLHGPGVTLTAADAASTPQQVTGAAAQTADLAQWMNATGTVLARVLASGRYQGLTTALAAAATDVPLQAQGVTGQSGDLQRFLDPTGAILARVSPRGQYLPPVAPTTTYGLDTAANGYRPLTITVTSGATTLSTATLTYDATSGNLTQIVTVADGRTVTKVLTYDANGNLASSTESITAGV